MNFNYLQKKFYILTFLFLSTCFMSTYGQLQVTEEIMTIPCYTTNAPNEMPQFFKQKGHQGVQRREYPYPFDDNFTFEKKPVEYPIIRMQNEYIDLAIMPQMGGRVYYAKDKTNGYDYFYHNHVVKPSLIGMVGNWVSGSLAWGFPHHHGPSTVIPMDYKIVKNTNGSTTVWISDTDRRHRLSMLIGYTVYPNSNVLEMSIQPMNNTPVSNSFLFWANPAVNVDSAYQVIFPPSVKYVTYHAKRDMTTWPIADGIYNNTNYKDMDVSWWKNTISPSSFFSWDPKEGYFGGYDHNKHAGTVWVGNRYLSPGMKYWADGNNPIGRGVNAGLTDSDSQYIELMAGFYSDNQPDYSWIEPYENKYGKMTWFPMRELAGIKFANGKGALNITAKDGKIQLRMNATSLYKNAKVVVSANSKTIFEQKLDISPAKPYVNDQINLPKGITEKDFEVILTDADNQTIMLYKAIEHQPSTDPRPTPLKALPVADEINNVEELYLAGLRLNQFYNPSISPIPYYEKALKLDPGHYGTNLQMGILKVKDFDWAVAESYLQKAVNRVSANYTRPKDCEALYYLAMTQRAQNNQVKAYENFYRASWDNAWNAPAYYQLAEMECVKGDFEKALEHIDRALTTAAKNIQLLNLKTVILRKLNKMNEAEKTALASLEVSVINHQATNELSIIYKAIGKTTESSKFSSELSRVMRGEIQSYLELASSYMDGGFYTEIIDLLKPIESKSETYPMLYYYLGYAHSKLGKSDLALKYYQTASSKPHDYCFPFRNEENIVLNDAMFVNPSDAKAPYYLGNLLYEKQPQKAIEVWEKSAQIDPTFYIVHRNLSIAYNEVNKDPAKALASIEKAYSCNNQDAKLLQEVDEMMGLNNVSIEKKYNFLKKNEKVAAKRSETMVHFAIRCFQYEKFDEAVRIMNVTKLVEQEGGTKYQNAYLNAYTLRGMTNFNAGKYQKALADFLTASKFPVVYGRNRLAQLYYLLGITYEKTGNKTEAKINFEKTINAVNTVPAGRLSSEGENLFYKGMALKNLGETEKANAEFDILLQYANDKIEVNYFFNQFDKGQSQTTMRAGKHYLAGLAYIGYGEHEKANIEFKKALELIPEHSWSKIYLSRK